MLSPEAGGSVFSWQVAGQNMLRNTADMSLAADQPLLRATFPLVPYSNRIANGRFTWAGQSHDLPVIPLAAPHAIHGVGWTAEWQVAQLAEDHCTLTLDHAGGVDWPYPFHAEQHIQLSADSMIINMHADNLSDQSVPLAFGHHPYFDQEGATLDFSATGLWLNRDDMLPGDCVAPEAFTDFLGGHAVEGCKIDHCYTGWNGKALIRWAGREHALEIAATPNLSAAVVYIPPGGDAFCFEPVPHMNDAINQADANPAMPIITPGERFAAEIILRAIKRSA